MRAPWGRGFLTSIWQIPSINLQNPLPGLWVGGANSATVGRRRPKQVASLLQGHAHMHNLDLFRLTNLPIKPDLWTLVPTGRTCRLLTERTQLAFEPGRLPLRQHGRFNFFKKKEGSNKVLLAAGPFLFPGALERRFCIYLQNSELEKNSINIR